jgi:hypothetical protein
LVVGEEFSFSERVSYLIFKSESDQAKGYLKFYYPGEYSVAIPAIRILNTTEEIPVSLVLSTESWWTAMTFLNTNDYAKSVAVIFNDGQRKDINLAPHQNKVVTIASLFDGQSQPSITSALIRNGEGVIALEFFGSQGKISGLVLKSERQLELCYPFLKSLNKVWACLVGANVSGTEAHLTLSPYTSGGEALAQSSIDLNDKDQYFNFNGLGLPEGTAWLKINSSVPINGINVFGTEDGLASYNLHAPSREGVLAKTNAEWNAITFVNVSDNLATVNLQAYNNQGIVLYEGDIDIAPHAEISVAFSEEDMSGVSHITYSANEKIIAFQLNGSGIGESALDALPGM